MNDEAARRHQEMAVGISSRKRGSFLLMKSLEKTTDAVDCVAHDVDGQEADEAEGRTGAGGGLGAAAAAEAMWTEMEG